MSESYSVLERLRELGLHRSAVSNERAELEQLLREARNLGLTLKELSLLADISVMTVRRILAK